MKLLLFCVYSFLMQQLLVVLMKHSTLNFAKQGHSTLVSIRSMRLVTQKRMKEVGYNYSDHEKVQWFSRFQSHPGRV